MALMSPQSPTNGILDPTFSAVNASDTIAYAEHLLLYVKVGATPCTITVVVPGNQPYSGAAKTDVIATSVTSDERVFSFTRDAVDPATNLVTVQYSPTTGVTAALIQA